MTQSKKLEMKLSRLLLIIFSVFIVSISLTACEEDDLTPNPAFDPDFNPDSARASNNLVHEDSQFASLDYSINTTIKQKK